MKFWFGSARKNRASIVDTRAPVSQSNARAKTALQREVVDVALQGTLIRHGIPRSWVAAELQVAPAVDTQSRSDICLVVRQWGGLPWVRAAAFQRTFVRRIGLLDPQQHKWLRGVVWQFKLAEEGRSQGGQRVSSSATVPAPLTELMGSPGTPPAPNPVPQPRQESASERQSRLAEASAKLLGGRWRDSNYAEFEDTMPLERAH